MAQSASGNGPSRKMKESRRWKPARERASTQARPARAGVSLAVGNERACTPQPLQAGLLVLKPGGLQGGWILGLCEAERTES